MGNQRIVHGSDGTSRRGLDPSSRRRITTTETSEEKLRAFRIPSGAGNSADVRLLAMLATATAGEKPHIQRELKRQPPGRKSDPSPLTEEKVADAMRFNTAMFSTHSIGVIQDLVGAPVTGAVDEKTIQMIVEWQADFRLTVDGKMGKGSLKPAALELIAVGRRNGAIWLIIDGHNLPTTGLTSISYDAAETSNASTSGPIPGDSTVTIGPTGFSQGYEGLVHTIAHELEHVRQRHAGMATQSTREFLGEAVEIMSVGTLPEGIAGVMDDAGRAVDRWNAMPAAEQVTNWARFQQVRDRVQDRFDNASAANQATHQVLMDQWRAVTDPAGAAP